jgi:cytosine/adenosine deaminase-related metal-dependent hydrolase
MAPGRFSARSPGEAITRGATSYRATSRAASSRPAPRGVASPAATSTAAAALAKRGRGGSLAARCVLLESGLELCPGELVWDATGTITALRRPRGPIADLCVLPGLVNAHAHLQIEPVDAPRVFLPWVRAVIAARLATSPAAMDAATRTAARQLLAEGVTAVGEIDSTGRTPRALAGTGLAGRCYQELTGFHLDASASRKLVRDRRGEAVSGLLAGLSPHAPYSVSPALFQAAAKATRHLAIHCAELPEEQQFLREGTGPFADLLRNLGRLPAGFRAPRVGAVRWLERLGVLRPGTQLVHCQELERGDLARIAASGAGIAVCPGTIAWFSRTPPPVPKWLAAGIDVALGTDSRASSDAFSLRAELRAAARFWPELSPQQLFTMATVAGGRTLGRPRLGRLVRGGRADFLCVTARSDRALAHLEPFVHGELAVARVFAAGHEVSRS